MKLEISVFDYDLTNNDDFMGRYYFMPIQFFQ
jgi:hypothetical protein